MDKIRMTPYFENPLSNKVPVSNPYPNFNYFYPEVRENKTSYFRNSQKISEKLLKCIWFDKNFSQPLKALDGREVTIISPGWWNTSAGPDFLNAVYSDENGSIAKGNVELHINKNDWKRHGHEGDKNYEDIAIHVFFHNDGAIEGPGLQPFQINIAPFLTKKIEEFKAEIDPDAYPLQSDSVLGECCPAMREMGPRRIAHLLDRAGEDRMNIKAKRLLDRLGEGGFDQLCYESVMEALGYRNHRKPFLGIAKGIPFETLTKKIEGLNKEDAVLMLQSFFLSASGIPEGLRREKDTGALSKEAEAYVEKIMGMKGYATGNKLFKSDKKESWILRGCRPSNFPQLRLAGATYLVERFARTGIFRLFLEKLREKPVESLSQGRGMIKEWTRSLTVDEPRDFWSFRYTLTGGKSGHPRKLIGPQRASVIVLNSIFPILLAYAWYTGDSEIEKKVFRLYTRYPLLPENSIQKFMNTFLLGERYGRSSCIDGAKKQQGLIHIFNEFCSANKKGCVECSFLEEMG